MSTFFTHTIVRTPTESMVHGITSAALGTPNFAKALQQHKAYIEALLQCGVEVIEVAGDSDFPDACFIEDVALCTSECAIITNPGAESRKGEEVVIAAVLEEYYDNIYHIQGPATIEAGDIMMVGSHYYIGLSDRTNQAGAEQMIGFLQKHGLNGSTVEMDEMLHLKTGLSYLENKNLVVAGEFIGKAAFKKYNHIVVADNEEYAANCIWVNDIVIVPAGHPKTIAKIEAQGYETIAVDVSEFQKLDGGLSCLSLRF